MRRSRIYGIASPSFRSGFGALARNDDIMILFAFVCIQTQKYFLHFTNPATMLHPVGGIITKESIIEWAHHRCQALGAS